MYLILLFVVFVSRISWFWKYSCRCDMLDGAVEMDRILRPGGVVIVEDTIQMLKKLKLILRSLHWTATIHHQRFLVGKKGFWRPQTERWTKFYNLVSCIILFSFSKFTEQIYWYSDKTSMLERKTELWSVFYIFIYIKYQSYFTFTTNGNLYHR